MNITFDIDDTVIRKFNSAVLLADADRNQVVASLMAKYAADVFRGEVLEQSAPQEEIPVPSSSNVMEEEETSSKALSRMEGWRDNVDCIPHKLIKAYLISENEGKASKSEMKFLCSNPDGELFIRNFDGNFNQMRYEKGRTYGKVFESHRDVVTLDPSVERVIREMQEDFRR